MELYHEHPHLPRGRSGPARGHPVADATRDAQSQGDSRLAGIGMEERRRTDLLSETDERDQADSGRACQLLQRLAAGNHGRRNQWPVIAASPAGD